MIDASMRSAFRENGCGEALAETADNNNNGGENVCQYYMCVCNTGRNERKISRTGRLCAMVTNIPSEFILFTTPSCVCAKTTVFHHCICYVIGGTLGAGNPDIDHLPPVYIRRFVVCINRTE